MPTTSRNKNEFVGLENRNKFEIAKESGRMDGREIRRNFKAPKTSMRPNKLETYVNASLGDEVYWGWRCHLK